MKILYFIHKARISFLFYFSIFKFYYKAFKYNNSSTIGEVFNNIYIKKKWQNQQQESLSGPGSTHNYTKTCREEIHKIITIYSINSLHDLGCGDCNWIKIIPSILSINYIGSDVSSFLLKKNISNQDLIKKNFTFLLNDIRFSKLKEADLFLLRDVLFHLSFDDIKLVFKNIKSSSFKYLLVTSSKKKDGTDIKSGMFREFNLKKSYIDYLNCKVVKSFPDFVDGYPEREMILLRKVI